MGLVYPQRFWIAGSVVGLCSLVSTQLTWPSDAYTQRPDMQLLNLLKHQTCLVCFVMRRFVTTQVRYDPAASSLLRFCLLLAAVMCFVLRCMYVHDFGYKFVNYFKISAQLLSQRF